MIELKIQKPYIDESGNVRETLEKHYAEDENGVRYKIIKSETNTPPYDEAVDLIPCRYTYQPTNIPIEEVRDGEV